MATLSEQLASMANGHWLDIFSVLAGDNLKAAINDIPCHVPCPKNMGGEDSFRLFKDANETGGSVSNQVGAMRTGFQTLMWINDWDFKTTLRELCAYFKLGDRYKCSAVIPVPKRTYVAPVITDETLSSRRKKLRYICETSFKINDPRSQIAIKYFRVTRGLDLTQDDLNRLSSDIRFHPNLQYWHEGVCYGSFPCLISIVRNNNREAVTIHKTYLNEHGCKLDVSQFPFKKERHNAKQIMPPVTRERIGGCCIQLFGMNDKRPECLSVAEGLETALSVYLGSGEVCWAGISASWLRSFMPPDHVTYLTMWSDNDETEVGQKTACYLIETLPDKRENLTVNAFTPHIPTLRNYDWNNYYIEYGRKGFEKFIIHPVM